MSLADEMQERVHELRRNTNLLETCEGPHMFEDAEQDSGTSLIVSSRCRLCGGVIPKSWAIWYEKGLAHGDPNRPKPEAPRVRVRPRPEPVEAATPPAEEAPRVRVRPRPEATS